MRLTGIKAESENRINVPALNGVLGWLYWGGEYSASPHESSVRCLWTLRRAAERRPGVVIGSS